MSRGGRRRRAFAEPGSPADRLFGQGYAFDFFQAVRLLQWLEPSRPGVGRSGPPSVEVVRFRARTSLNFPPSAVHDIGRPPGSAAGPPVLVQSFLGLTGPSGVLPRHYTELLMRLIREQRGPERYAFRDWLDLFNHRLTSLFYRAWEKYRFYLHFERGNADRVEPDSHTQALLSLVGLGTAGLRDRLRVTGSSAPGSSARTTLARVDDLAAVYYAGHFAHRPRSAVGLEALVRDYFGVQVEVRQFQGQWLQLEPSSMTRLGVDGGNNSLGVNAIAGDRVWDVQGQFRLRVGPLGLDLFNRLLPEVSPHKGRNSFFLLTHLVRFYAGPELDFDVQLVLNADEVPECRLPADDETGPALGWNTWLRSEPFTRDADDAVFAGAERTRVEGPDLR